jgi:hypothetical protein
MLLALDDIKRNKAQNKKASRDVKLFLAGWTGTELMYKNGRNRTLLDIISRFDDYSRQMLCPKLPKVV